jgi:hypothetical protein
MVQLYDNPLELEYHGNCNKSVLGRTGNLEIQESLVKYRGGSREVEDLHKNPLPSCILLGNLRKSPDNVSSIVKTIYQCLRTCPHDKQVLQQA